MKLDIKATKLLSKLPACEEVGFLSWVPFRFGSGFAWAQETIMALAGLGL